MGTSLPSIIIPTLNAVNEIGGLLRALLAQTLDPLEILVVDSSSEDGTAEVVRGYSVQGVRLKVIDRAAFDHGGTRRMAVAQTSGEFFVVLTQDAVPADEFLLERLVSPFDDPLVAASGGRQIAKPGSRSFERLVREFNYPPRVMCSLFRGCCDSRNQDGLRLRRLLRLPKRLL